jgi:hypothetical protein
MTCDSVLETLLDADLTEISAGGITPLGRHLRECPRCCRLGVQLLTDTQLLAAAMETSPVRHPTRRVRHLMLAPAAAFAAVVIVTLLRAGPVGVRAIPPVVVTPAAAPAVNSNEPTMSPDVNSVAGAGAAPVRLQPARAFPAPVPIAPVRVEQGEPPAVESVVASRAVTVATQPGTRAAVLHTSDPKLVVVWLY